MTKEELDKIKELLILQGSPGNWNCNPYMLGMYNGMELVVALLEGREPMFREKPDEWLDDRILINLPSPEVSK